MCRSLHPSVSTTPTRPTSPTGLPRWAEHASRQLLAGHPSRLAHTLAVGRQARHVSQELRLPEPDADCLEAAAVLHDVGYAHALRQTGFHPIDGARYVLTMTDSQVLAAFVAHHSQAVIEARLRGLARAMDQFEKPDTVVSDALTYCDMTVGPQGQPMTVDQRLADVHHRYEPNHVVARAVTDARPLLLAAVHRTATRIRAATADGQRKTV